jgi:hypothetical protein
MLAKLSICGSAISVCALSFVGCGESPDKAVATPAATQVAAETHNHEGWWCEEHGVPEEICAQCNFKLAADYKAKGDWCKKHDRPESQCFICHPEKEAEFAAQYEAKFGKKPPKPTESAAASEPHSKS